MPHDRSPLQRTAKVGYLRFYLKISHDQLTWFGWIERILQMFFVGIRWKFKIKFQVKWKNSVYTMNGSLLSSFCRNLISFSGLKITSMVGSHSGFSGEAFIRATRIIYESLPQRSTQLLIWPGTRENWIKAILSDNFSWLTAMIWSSNPSLGRYSSK